MNYIDGWEIPLRTIEGMVKEEWRPVNSYAPGDLREIHFELTFQCNQQCMMCDVRFRYKQLLSLKEKELDAQEIFKFVTNSRYLEKLNLVLFSGGEPFLREDLSEICGFFIKRYRMISVGVLSNLFATELVVKRVKEIMSFKPVVRC